MNLEIEKLLENALYKADVGYGPTTGSWMSLFIKAIEENGLVITQKPNYVKALKEKHLANKVYKVTSDKSDSFTEYYDIEDSLGSVRIKICCMQAYIYRVSDRIITYELDYKLAREFVWTMALEAAKNSLEGI